MPYLTINNDRTGDGKNAAISAKTPPAEYKNDYSGELYIIGILTFILMFSVSLIYPVLEEFVMERFRVESVAETSLLYLSPCRLRGIRSCLGSISDMIVKEKCS